MTCIKGIDSILRRIEFSIRGEQDKDFIDIIDNIQNSDKANGSQNDEDSISKDLSESNELI